MQNKNITLKLYDYLTGKCPFKGCSNNCEGICLSNDIDHHQYISKIVDYALDRDKGVLDNQNIICKQLDVQEGHCEFCGVKKIQTHESHPYGDTKVMEVLSYCPKCK